MLLHYLPRQYGHFLIPIVQWGFIPAPNIVTHDYTLTLPIAFTSKSYIFIRTSIACVNMSGLSLTYNIGYKTKTLSQVILNLENGSYCGGNEYLAMGC